MRNFTTFTPPKGFPHRSNEVAPFAQSLCHRRGIREFQFAADRQAGAIRLTLGRRACSIPER